MVNKLYRKIKEKYITKLNVTHSKLHFIYNSAAIMALIVFLGFTIISYDSLKYSDINQSKVYEDGYLSANYANKINEDILNIKIYSLLYTITQNKITSENLRIYGNDIDDNINKYKLLHNLTDEEKDIICRLDESNKSLTNEIDKMIENIESSKSIEDSEMRKAISISDTESELSNRLIKYSNRYISMLHDQNKAIESQVMHTIVIINFSVIALFVLMIFIVSKINKKMNYYAFCDSITGLPNRNYVANTLVKDIEKISKDEYAIVINLDMDNFKAVNDTLGHSTGDKLLKQAGKRFKKVIDSKDYVCHIGGDEFLFLIKSVNNKYEAELLVKRIQNIFKVPFHIDGKKIDYVTASLGIAIVNMDGNTFETLYNYADDAMYASKRLGKNKYSFYDKEMHSNIYEKTLKKKAIEEGIKKGEFKVFYQPKVSNKEKFLGAEALVRWIKEDNKIMPPSEFIEFAENEGLIQYIGEVVIIEVCEKISEWIKKGYKNFRIAINLSAEQLINEELCDKCLNIIGKFKIPFEYIEFEVTESIIIKDFNVAIKNIEKIKSNGIKVSLDDFGTGYSSLNYLKNLSIDSVKIDKSFIDNLVFDDASNVMVNEIIKICHYFGYEVVAEGVEKNEQVECLRDLNCDIFQGYYYGKPMNSAEFENRFFEPIL